MLVDVDTQVLLHHINILYQDRQRSFSCPRPSEVDSCLSDLITYSEVDDLSQSTPQNYPLVLCTLVVYFSKAKNIFMNLENDIFLLKPNGEIDNLCTKISPSVYLVIKWAKVKRVKSTHTATK